MSISFVIWTGFCLALALIGGNVPRTASNPHPALAVFGFWLLIWTVGISVFALASWWANA